MLCENCQTEIPEGETYFKLHSTEQIFCCTACVTDHMIYRNMLSIETNTDNEDD